MTTLQEAYFYQFRDNGGAWSQSRAYETKEEAEEAMRGNVPAVKGREGRVMRRADDVVSTMRQ